MYPRSRKSRPEVAVHCIEGQFCTVAEIAERLGRTPKAVSSLLSRARRKPGPITWARLEAEPTHQDPTP